MLPNSCCSGHSEQSRECYPSCSTARVPSGATQSKSRDCLLVGETCRCHFRFCTTTRQNNCMAITISSYCKLEGLIVGIHHQDFNSQQPIPSGNHSSQFGINSIEEHVHLVTKHSTEQGTSKLTIVIVQHSSVIASHLPSAAIRFHATLAIA